MALFRPVGYTDNYTYVEAGSWVGAHLGLHFHNQVAPVLNMIKYPFKAGIASACNFVSSSMTSANTEDNKGNVVIEDDQVEL